MFVPDTIPDSILAVYHTKTQKKVKNQLQSEDFTKWCENQVKTLRKLCLDVIVIHWEDLQIIDEFVLDEDARYVLDNLPTDLPFKLAVTQIHDDLYWRRAFRARWAGKMLPTKPIKLDYDIPNQFSRTKTTKTTENMNEIVKINTWKCFYVERHFQDVLEHLKPEEYQSEEMKELIELSQDYIIRLKLNQLQAPGDHQSERIPLNAILPALINLKQLNICFKQTYVGDDFSWHILQTTSKDIENFGKGLHKCNLEVLRIINTDITCEKLTILACQLTTNKQLRILDFSHCKIGDEGTVALCKLILELPNLTELNLMNNFIGLKGLEFLCFTLSKADVKLKRLDLNLNTFGPSAAAGAEFLARMLVENTQLVDLNLGACGLTADNVELLITALQTNATLSGLNLSNNSLNEEVGNSFIKLLKTSNSTLKSLDLRMTLIPSEIVLIIEEILENAQQKSLKNQSFNALKHEVDVNKKKYQETGPTTTTTNKEIEPQNKVNSLKDLTDINKEDEITDKININTDENADLKKEFHKGKEVPPFYNVDDMEAQVDKVFENYYNTLKRELNDCCDKYINEEINEHNNDIQIK